MNGDSFECRSKPLFLARGRVLMTSFSLRGFSKCSISQKLIGDTKGSLHLKLMPLDALTSHLKCNCKDLEPVRIHKTIFLCLYTLYFKNRNSECYENGKIPHKTENASFKNHKLVIFHRKKRYIGY